MKQNIPTQLKKEIISILKKHAVKKSAIFGSFVNGKVNKNSDIDILVEVRNDKTLLDLVGLKLDLEKKLKRKVDVLTYNSLHPLLKDKILREQKIIYEGA